MKNRSAKTIVLILSALILFDLNKVRGQSQSDSDADDALEKGFSAYEGHDYKSALEDFQKAADEGDASSPFAMHMLGIIYQTGGYGVSRDPEKALAWYLKAAKAGSHDETSKVYSGYLIGAAKDYEKAVQWLRERVKTGDPVAMRLLSKAYAKGKLVTADNNQAINLLETAAETGDLESMRDLGKLYAKGRLSPGFRCTVDLRVSLTWYKKAVSAGSATSMEQVADLLLALPGGHAGASEALKWYEKLLDLPDKEPGEFDDLRLHVAEKIEAVLKNNPTLNAVSRSLANRADKIVAAAWHSFDPTCPLRKFVGWYLTVDDDIHIPASATAVDISFPIGVISGHCILMLKNGAATERVLATGSRLKILGADPKQNNSGEYTSLTVEDPLLSEIRVYTAGGNGQAMDQEFELLILKYLSLDRSQD